MRRLLLVALALVGFSAGVASCCGTDLTTFYLADRYEVVGWDGFEAPLSPAFVDVTDTEVIVTHEGENGTLTVRYQKVEQLAP